MPTKVKAILFDFVGVLMEPDAQGITSSIADAVDSVVGNVVDDAQFQRHIQKKYGLSDLEFELILDQIVDKYRPFEALWKLLPELRKKFRVGIINNGTYLTFARFNLKYRIDQNFDLFLSSALEGIRKPDPRIFMKACAKLNVLPEQCIFMDDSLINVSSAINVGMYGIWWESYQTGMWKFTKWLSAASDV